MKKALLVMIAVCVVGVGLAVPVRAEEAKKADEAKVVKVDSAKAERISENCEGIREKLINVQHADSRARVYLGRYYETMLSKFIMPLNVWLVGRNLSNAGLIENQNSFAGERDEFVADYIAYQKELEELVATNCKAEPEKFYEKLVGVRKMRAVVASDMKELRGLMGEQVKLVTKLGEEL